MQFRVTVALMALAVFLCISQNGFSENEFLRTDTDVVDFGTIEEGDHAATTVTIQNTGKTPVEITNLRTN